MNFFVQDECDNSGKDHIYSSKFSLKLVGIFEINFDLLNVTKKYLLSVDGKLFCINFDDLKEEILEFNNYITEVNGLTDKSVVDIFLCNEKEFLILNFGYFIINIYC